MSVPDDDFDASLSQAEVKEDFMDCGFEGDAAEPPRTPVQQEIKLKNNRRSVLGFGDSWVESLSDKGRTGSDGKMCSSSEFVSGSELRQSHLRSKNLHLSPHFFLII